MATTTRRQFTDAFKCEAVRLSRESGRPMAQVARELGISDNVLYRWRGETSPTSGPWRAGSTWQSCWICTRAEWLVGPWGSD